MLWATCLVLVGGVAVVNGQLSCQDIDTSACKLMAQQQQDLCSNTAIAESACKRYCNLCRLECYQCNETLADSVMCNNTQVCKDGEVCMQKELKSIVDGHHEYQMTCESRATCDGAGLSINFVGKRNVQARDVSITCCADDLCNYPQMMTTTMKTTAMPLNGNCMKDVIIIVDESLSMQRIESDISHFLYDVVSKLPIGPSASLVSMATFAATATDRWDLDTHTDMQSLLNAIKLVHFRGGNGDNTVALQYLVNKATTTQAGDRPNVPDVVILITDDTSHRFFQTSLLSNALSHKSSDVITIGLGQAARDSEIDQIATDSGHAFHLRGANSLPGLSPKLVSLICE